MKVKQFEEKYAAIQEEAKELNAKLSPLLKQVRKLGMKASSLAIRADLDKSLYRVDEKDGELVEDGWNIAILHRLAYMDNRDEVDVILDSLYNLIHTPFIKKTPKKGE